MSRSLATPTQLNLLNARGLLGTAVARQADNLTDEELGWAIIAEKAGAMEKFALDFDTAREVLDASDAEDE